MRGTAKQVPEAQPVLPADPVEEPTDRLPPPPECAEPAPFSWQVAAASWVGLVRRNNQDSAVSSPRLAAVADGMGGEAAGDLASMVAARRLWLAAADPSTVALADAVEQAGTDIARLVEQDRFLDGMGTTVCAALFDGRKLNFIHIGDSRAYRWRDGQLTQLTHDHSFVQQLIDQGHLTEDEARVHPRRSLVMRVVNGTALGAPDSFTETPQLGDRYLFCSDGLSSYVEAGAIAAALGASTIEESVDIMLEDASAAGAPDNVTIVATAIIPQDDGIDATAAQLWGAASAMTPPDGPAPAPADRQSSAPADRPSSAPTDGSAEVAAEGPDAADDIVAELARWGAHLPPATVAPRPSSARGHEAKPHRSARAGASAHSAASARSARRVRRLIVTVIVLLVLVVGAGSATAWVRSQYFIGVVDGQAAIFRGVPYKIGPWYLSRIAEPSTVNLADLPVFYADQVNDWAIRPGSLAAAEQSIAQLKTKADACIAAKADPNHTADAEDCP